MNHPALTYYLLFFCFLIGFRKGSSQVNVVSLDTIYCASSNTTYILFTDKVDLVDVGRPDDFAVKIEDNAVFIKSIRATSTPSTLFIRIGKLNYLGIICFKEDNKKFFYDCIHSMKMASDSLQKSSTPNLGGKSSFKQYLKSPEQAARLNQMESLSTELTTLGFISRYIDVAVTAIRNDEQNTFLKIILKNKSSIPYKLDFISFQYFQHLSKGAIRKAKKNAIDVFPVSSPAIAEVPALNTQHLLYAIPSFGLASRGYLLILFRERNGDRILKIKIDGSVIQNAKVLI